MDSSPHQKWVERLKLEIKKIIEPINITYEHFINEILEDQLTPNLEIVNHLKQNKVSQDKIIKAFNAANVLIINKARRPVSSDMGKGGFYLF